MSPDACSAVAGTRPSRHLEKALDQRFHVLAPEGVDRPTKTIVIFVTPGLKLDSSAIRLAEG
jgi:hypothetical protein